MRRPRTPSSRRSSTSPQVSAELGAPPPPACSRSDGRGSGPLPGYVEPLQALSEVTAQLDAVASLALASVSAPVPYVRPRLLGPAQGPRRMELLQARHPCMEADADTAFIPNDITFTQGDKSFYIITGEPGSAKPDLS